jgi:hypothetical protein
MLTKLTDTVSYNLLSLLAVLFIAMGMPLLHPVLHNHFEHHHISENHGAEKPSEVPSKNKEHDCPICDFQATSQFFSISLIPVITDKNPFFITLSSNHLSLVKTCSAQTEARAPPYCTHL